MTLIRARYAKNTVFTIPIIQLENICSIDTRADKASKTHIIEFTMNNGVKEWHYETERELKQEFKETINRYVK